ncbi:hypothetical protein [Streptomyces sp. NPDC050164]|uniref:hypothetical protein n=1 Tax=Streptomyces sp. NPDC050164 TaxID=3365605 RepID=UPI00378FE757
MSGYSTGYKVEGRGAPGPAGAASGRDARQAHYEDLVGDAVAAMLPEPTDRDERVRWRFARDHGREYACKHDQRRPVATLDLKTRRAMAGAAFCGSDQETPTGPMSRMVGEDQAM